MPRLHRFEDINFPVQTYPMFAAIADQPIKWQKPTLRIPGKKAVVNTANGRVVGVVSSGYQLITNCRALEAAKQCCTQLFPETHPSEWEISVVDAPSTGSSCDIDLIHNTTKLDFDFVLTGIRPDVPETFGPFIRVTNSYNGRHALKFSIGFYRKTCANGLVGPDIVIRFQFDHTRSGIGRGIKFDIKHERFEKMKNDFVKGFRDLSQCKIGKQQFRSLVAGVLGLKKPKEFQEPNQPENISIEQKEWQKLQNYIEKLNQHYISELGQNAYAALNVLTDFASQPPESLYVRRSRHSFQKLAGEWLVSFRKEFSQPYFSWDEHLAKLTQGKPINASEGVSV